MNLLSKSSAKAVLLAAIAGLLSILCLMNGFSAKQSLILFIFLTSILGTLFFWNMRVGLVFAGTVVLFLTRAFNLNTFIQYASFDVIIFLIGMMIVIGAIKETGIFHFLAGAILRVRRLNGVKMFIILGILSAAFSALMGEVASILLMVAIIFDISESLDIKPAPLVIFSVLTTNIGSASTLLGNPVGVLLALRGGLSFEDFLRCALPVSFVVLFAVIAILAVWYRPYVKEISARLSTARKASGVNRGMSTPFSLEARSKISIAIFFFMITAIALHKRVETFFEMKNNAVLVIAPVLFSVLLLALRRERAKYYVKEAVDWTSILFFIFLFAQTGAIQVSGIGLLFAQKITGAFGTNPKMLEAMVLFSSGFLSSVLDNTVVVASYIPVVQNLHLLHFSLKPLWWCILFGACYGGNITIIGSTANIVAIGALEREGHIRISFMEWFKIGLLIGIISMVIAYFAITTFNVFSV